jgi:hypothetical protein
MSLPPVLFGREETPEHMPCRARRLCSLLSSRLPVSASKTEHDAKRAHEDTGKKQRPLSTLPAKRAADFGRSVNENTGRRCTTTPISLHVIIMPYIVMSISSLHTSLSPTPTGIIRGQHKSMHCWIVGGGAGFYKKMRGANGWVWHGTAVGCKDAAHGCMIQCMRSCLSG